MSATAVSVPPRVCWVPAPADDSLGDRAVEFCRSHGGMLDPEQELMLRAPLGVRADGRWQAREVAYNLPRQNGKGEVLMWRELFGLYELGERLVIHTAHEFKTSAEHFQRLEAVVRANEDLDGLVKRRPSGQVVGYRYSHGEESITLQDGRRIEFKTRTKSGLRGFAGVDFLALDEAMIIPEHGLNSALPTIRASKAQRGPQICFAGSAVDQESHEHGIVWSRVRERGIEGGDEALAYLEWSLDFDHPDSVPEDVLNDPAVWRRVNFAIEHGRVLEEHMAWELRVMGRRGFVVELLGVGDYPRADGMTGPIDIDLWRELVDKMSQMVDSVCIAYDVSPDRSKASIAAAGRRQDGRFHVEVIENRKGTEWLPTRIAEIVGRQRVARVDCDAASPAASLVHALSQHGVQVHAVDSREYAQACGRLVDAVVQENLRHLGSDELASAIRGAATRPLVDAWAWSRRSSGTDITPLVAVTLAHSAMTEQGGSYVFDVAGMLESAA